MEINIPGYETLVRNAAFASLQPTTLTVGGNIYLATNVLLPAIYNAPGAPETLRQIKEAADPTYQQNGLAAVIAKLPPNFRDFLREDHPKHERLMEVLSEDVPLGGLHLLVRSGLILTELLDERFCLGPFSPEWVDDKLRSEAMREIGAGDICTIDFLTEPGGTISRRNTLYDVRPRRIENEYTPEDMEAIEKALFACFGQHGMTLDLRDVTHEVPEVRPDYPIKELHRQIMAQLHERARRSRDN